MKKFKNLMGFLLKGALSVLLVVLYISIIVEMYEAQVWFTPSMAVVLFVAVALGVGFLIMNMPKPKWRLNLVPALGLFIAFDRTEPSVQILILFIHIEIAVK